MFRGERAAVDGAKALGWDSFQRVWRHREEAQAGWARLEPQVQANYRSFAAGIEAFMTEHPERVPPNAIDLDAIDFVLLPRALFFYAYQAVEGVADCIAGGVEIDPLLALPGTGAGADSGLGGTESNGWAVMPRRTSDGATIVLSDPHVEIGLPIYWEYRVHAGTLHSSGFMMGAALWQAHTRDVSWAMTTGSPDVADCYEIEIDPDHPRRYRFDGEWRDLEVMTTSIEVAGSSPVERVVRVHAARRRAVAGGGAQGRSRLGGERGRDARRGAPRPRDPSAEPRARHRRGALRDGAARHVPADGDRGRPPRQRVLRARRQVAAAARPGSTGRSRSMVRPLRARGGDSTPWPTTSRSWTPKPGSSTTPTTRPTSASSGAGAYPDYLFHDQPGRTTWRGYRAGEVLGGNGDVTWDDATALALDQTWPATTRWRAALETARAAFPEALAKDEALGAFVARLLRFDGRAAAGSSDALAFDCFRNGLFAAVTAAGIALERRPGRGAKDELDAKLARVVLDQASRARVAWMAAGGEQATLGERFRIGRDGGHGIGGVTIDEPAIPDCRARLSPFCDVTLRALQADAAGLRRTAARHARLAGAASGAVHRSDPFVHAPSLRTEPGSAVAALRRSIEARRRAALEADLVRARRADATPRIGARARECAAPTPSSAAEP